MVILQAVIALLRRSVGRVFQSIFGWAVYVLFGAVARDEKTWLAAAVAGAAVWPVLLAGSVFPRVAAFVLTFVPLHESVPVGALRIGWIVLALAVPIFVGWVIRGRSGNGHGVLSVLSGVPITLGIAAAFLVAFFVVPVQKLVALLRGEKTDLVPLIVEERHRDAVARAICEVLGTIGFEVQPRKPPRLHGLISKILGATAVAAGRGGAAPPIYFTGGGLAVTMHPNGVDLRGRPLEVLRAHAAIAECATTLPALQTTDPEAQELERRIRHAWRISRPSADPSRTRDLRALARELSLLDCPWEEWEIVYRQVLQLHLAIQGAPQLLAGAAASARTSAGAGRRSTFRRRGAREPLRRRSGAAEAD